MTPARRARLGVLISGSGRTLMNLHDRAGRGALDAEIAGVIASRPCGGAERARAAGLNTEIVPGEIPAGALVGWAERLGVDLLVLAGYLRRVPVPDRLRRRIVNIHPALLPGDGTGGRFGGPGMYGMKVHRAVLGSGVAESGCTVHFCDEGYDTGPIILQRRCPVLPGDTPESLADRVFSLELDAYPDALQLLIDRGGITE